MRFAVMALALWAGQAGAVELSCQGSPGESVCSHPLATTLPYEEIHLSQPGTFDAKVSFASPLSNELTFMGLRYFHYDEYNDLTGYLFSGTDSYQGDPFVSYLLPAGLTGFSFRYTIPEFTYRHYPQEPGNAFPSTAVIGSVNQFVFNSAGLPRVSMSIYPTSSPVPEPASWALMIAGMGMIGMTMRRRQSQLALP